jgi:hypothetical protein
VHERLLLGVHAHVEAGGAQRTQRVEQHGEVDHLLEERTPGGGQVPGCGDAHGHQRQADAHDHALARDAARAAGDDHRIAEAVEPVDGQHDVGRLGRRGRAAGADGDADVGQGERRRVVDPVADHDRAPQPSFAADDLDLLGGGALGQDLVHPDHGATVSPRRPGHP